jgi:hypothetical protein
MSASAGVADSAQPWLSLILLSGSSCRYALRQSHRAGDHLIVLGEVVALVHRPRLEPLIFHSGTYKSLEHESRPAALRVA